MKAVNLMLLVVALASGVAAQDSTNTPGVLGAPGVEVIKSSWRRVERNLLLEQDPLRVNTQQANLQSAQIAALRENAARANADPPQPPVPIPTQGSAHGVMLNTPWVQYVYELKLRNTGAKTIRRLVWEYVLPHPDALPQFRSRRYESKTTIRPGKTKNLVVRTTSPPLGVIDARQLSKNPQDQSPEQLVIRRIEYADGSVWVRASN